MRILEPTLAAVLSIWVSGTASAVTQKNSTVHAKLGPVAESHPLRKATGEIRADDSRFREDHLNHHLSDFGEIQVRTAEKVRTEKGPAPIHAERMKKILFEMVHERGGWQQVLAALKKSAGARWDANNYTLADEHKLPVHDVGHGDVEKLKFFEHPDFEHGNGVNRRYVEKMRTAKDPEVRRAAEMKVFELVHEGGLSIGSKQMVAALKESKAQLGQRISSLSNGGDAAQLKKLQLEAIAADLLIQTWKE